MEPGGRDAFVADVAGDDPAHDGAGRVSVPEAADRQPGRIRHDTLGDHLLGEGRLHEEPLAERISNRQAGQRNGRPIQALTGPERHHGRHCIIGVRPDPPAARLCTQGFWRSPMMEIWSGMLWWTFLKLRWGPPRVRLDVAIELGNTRNARAVGPLISALN